MLFFAQENLLLIIATVKMTVQTRFSVDAPKHKIVATLLHL
jgi:hypothetical protein